MVESWIAVIIFLVALVVLFVLRQAKRDKLAKLTPSEKAQRALENMNPAQKAKVAEEEAQKAFETMTPAEKVIEEKTEEGVKSQSQLYPVFTWMRSYGTALAVIIGMLSIVGYFSILTLLPGDITTTQIVIGIASGVLSGLGIQLWAEIAGILLNIEENTRLVVDTEESTEEVPST